MKKDLDELKKILKQHKPELKSRFNVTRIGIFGSYARGTAKKNSDLDVLVKLSEPIGLFEFVGLKYYIEEITSLKSDVVTVDSVRPEFRKNIDDEVIFL
jgi:predicted nucleotidyltransferase